MSGLVACIGFAWVKWRLRYGLRDGDDSTAGRKKQAVLQTGVRGEHMLTGTRGASATFSLRNYMPSRAKGELDLWGF